MNENWIRVYVLFGKTMVEYDLQNVDESNHSACLQNEMSTVMGKSGQKIKICETFENIKMLCFPENM